MKEKNIELKEKKQLELEMESMKELVNQSNAVE